MRAFCWMVVALVSCTRGGAPPGYVYGDDGLPVVLEDPDAPLPFDPAVHRGVLDNGLQWFVEHNGRPSGRAEIRLIVRVGSILEEEEERGVAHYLEHLAFNGTRNFPGRSLVAWLEGLGMRFGADLNAYTGFDETAYLLQVPTDDLGVVARAFDVLRDWADGIVFDDEECERERGVVLEEWRQSGGLSERLQAATVPQVFYGSRYVNRLPIGGEEAIQSLDCDKARRFYERWYRPELMGVIVVGDLDPAWVQEQIEDAMGGLAPAGPDAPERVIHTVPDHDEVLVTRWTDPELSGRLVSVLHKTDVVQEDTHGGYRRFLVAQVAGLVLQERLGLRSTEPDAPFEIAGLTENALGLTRVAQALQAAAKPGREAETLRELLEVRRQLQVHGALPGELERARRALMTNMEAYYAERDKTDSSTHADELQRHFLEGEPVPGIPYEYALARVMVPTIDRDELDRWFRSARFLPAGGRVVQLLAPAGTALPSEEEVRALVAEIDEALPPPLEEVTGEVSLVADPPEPGEVVERSTDPRLGTTTLRLSNGVRVVIRPTDLQEDRVVVSGFSLGGASALPDELYLAGLMANRVVRASGVAGLSVRDLARMMGGRALDLDVSLSGDAEVFYGESTRAEWATLLEWMHAQVVDPRLDAEVFAEAVRSRREQIRRQLSSPESRMEAHWQQMLWQGHPQHTPWTEEELDSVSLASVEQAWRERFADLSDLTLVVVGSLSPEEAEEGLRQWIATLPGEGRKGEVVDRGARRRGGPWTEWIEDPDATQANVRVLFHAPWPDSLKDRMILDGLASLLEARLHEVLREDLGGTYGVGVSEGVSRHPEPRAVLTIRFACDPGRVDELLMAMDDVIEETRIEVWPDVVAASFREKNLRERETSMQSNAWWAGVIAGHLRRGEEPAALLEFDRWNDAVRGEAIQEAAEALLRPEHRVQLVQTPPRTRP